MGKQNKRVNESKEDEWHLVDEKIFHLQGTRPKTNRKQRLPAVRPAIGPDVNEEKQRNLGLLSIGNRHFQPKSKCSLLSPQELISVDNVSHVTDRKANMLPYCRTNCAPLPRNSPSKIFPSRVSPRRRSFSAPGQMSFSSQWSSLPELLNSENNHVTPESTQNSLLGITSRQNNKDVHLPYKPQHHGPCGKSEKSH